MWTERLEYRFWREGRCLIPETLRIESYNFQMLSYKIGLHVVMEQKKTMWKFTTVENLGVTF